MDRSDETWKPAAEIPAIERGREREFVIAVRRARNGSVYSFAASYLNAFPLNYRDGCPKGDGCAGDGCDDGCPTTGWFRLTGDDGDSWQYQSLDLGKGDELLGWRNIPQWTGTVVPTVR